jgi:hypothetical protein
MAHTRSQLALSPSQRACFSPPQITTRAVMLDPLRTRNAAKPSRLLMCP